MKISYFKPFGAIFFLISIGCKKEIQNAESIPVNNTTNQASIFPFPFNWETADYMPTPPGTAILVPWASGSNQLFDPAVAFDFKKNDGWQLVYNTFNTTALASPSYFALYNKYRGLLRIYLYLPPMPATPSTYFNHGLALSGSGNSSMLNYIGQDIIDANVKLTNTTQVERWQIQSTGGWYVMQYEIAYDPGIATTSYQTLNFIWSAKSINITEVSLYGTLSGTLKGTINQPASTPNLSAGSAGTSITKGILQAVSEAAITNLLNGVPTDIGSAAHVALTQGLTGVVKNVFSAVFGGSSGSIQQVNLTFNAKIGLAGSLTNSSALGNNTLVIPGSANSQVAPGYVPGYNSVMGVFNLTAKPKVRDADVATANVINIPGGFGAKAVQHRHTYTIDAASFSVVFNQAVINSSSGGAQVQNLKQELVLIEPGPFLNSYGVPSAVTTDGTVEQVGNYKDVRVNLTRSDRYQVSYGTTVPFHQSHGFLGIRISFDVVPNNGAPHVKIVKTFSVDEMFI